MAQAYDFALEKMGMDISSYQIWNDYVKFLKGVDAVGSYAENQKISAIRKVYQKGVVNPMFHIEQFWYDTTAQTLFVCNFFLVIQILQFSSLSIKSANRGRIRAHLQVCKHFDFPKLSFLLSLLVATTAATTTLAKRKINPLDHQFTYNYPYFIVTRLPNPIFFPCLLYTSPSPRD